LDLRLSSNTRHSLHDRLGRRFGGLRIALVEVKRRVELGLAGEQFLQACIVLESPASLRLIVGQRFLEPFDTMAFIFGIDSEAAWERSRKVAEDELRRTLIAGRVPCRADSPDRPPEFRIAMRVGVGIDG
jgi:hypothetical protein